MTQLATTPPRYLSDQELNRIWMDYCESPNGRLAARHYAIRDLFGHIAALEIDVHEEIKALSPAERAAR